MLSFACWRCADFIDVRPENSPTYTNYFKTLDDAEALLTGLQVRMKAIYKRGKIAVRGEYADEDPSNYFMKDMNVLYAKQDWGDFYDVIYQADLILDNAHRFQVSEEEIKPYVLQAYFAKAVAYFGLARKVRVPAFPSSILDRLFTLTFSSPMTFPPRNWAISFAENSINDSFLLFGLFLKRQSTHFFLKLENKSRTIFSCGHFASSEKISICLFI